MSVVVVVVVVVAGLTVLDRDAIYYMLPNTLTPG